VIYSNIVDGEEQSRDSMANDYCGEILNPCIINVHVGGVLHDKQPRWSASPIPEQRQDHFTSWVSRYTNLKRIGT
jgi:hypothetical protein